jgi:hypothetical protein
MGVHHGFLPGGVFDPNDANPVILEFDRVVSGVGHDRVFAGHRRDREHCRRPKSMQNNFLEHHLTLLAYRLPGSLSVICSPSIGNQALWGDGSEMAGIRHACAVAPSPQEPGKGGKQVFLIHIIKFHRRVCLTWD